jgi:hypothetical protein
VTADLQKEADSLVQHIRVKASDWRKALLTGAEPCSRRQGLPALTAAAMQPMPGHLAPALLPTLAQALHLLHNCGLPLPPDAALAASHAAHPSQQGQALSQDVQLEQLKAELVRIGAIDSAGKLHVRLSAHRAYCIYGHLREFLVHRKHASTWQ